MSFLSTVITDAIVKLEGSEELVGIATVTLPDIENKTEEVTGLGTGNFEAVVVGLYNALSITLKFRGMAKSNLKSKGKPVDLIINAAIQGQDRETGEVVIQKLTVTARGQVKSAKEGELARGGKIEPERVLALTYYKYEIDGEVQYEIDTYNRKAIIDGEDVLAAVNAALGA